MADAVSTNVIFSGPRRYVVHLTNICDSTGEAAVKKVDISTLTGTLGVAPNDLALEKVSWNTEGFTYVLLEWDATANDAMIVLTGHGETDFTEAGVLIDPQSTGSTGDVMLTTAGNAAGDIYNMTLTFRLRN